MFYIELSSTLDNLHFLSILLLIFSIPEFILGGLKYRCAKTTMKGLVTILIVAAINLSITVDVVMKFYNKFIRIPNFDELVNFLSIGIVAVICSNLYILITRHLYAIKNHPINLPEILTKGYYDGILKLSHLVIFCAAHLTFIASFIMLSIALNNVFTLYAIAIIIFSFIFVIRDFNYPYSEVKRN